MGDVGSRLDRLFREESGRLHAAVIRALGGDFGAAEEVVQEAFAAAWAQWPRDGVPREPRAWLLSAARHKAVDRVRRAVRFHTREEALAAEACIDAALAPPAPGTEWDALPDDTLRLLFTCCHPALAPEAQVALALRTLCGLTTEEVARAFLVSPQTLAQRLVRAQRKIREARIPYRVPGPGELAERTGGVLHTVYLVFSEGYAATAGEALVRPDLCREALRLGRLAHALLPRDGEAAALLALMLLHHARREARLAPDGGLVLLDRQDRARWDREALTEGLATLERALGLGACGPYALQAAIAALHAQAPRAEDTDWRQIALLYERLLARAPGPVVALNHAAAVAHADGPERALALVDGLEATGRLTGYHLLPAARAELLRRLGRFPEAAEAYHRALARVRTLPERRFLEERLAEVLAQRAP